jgi:hypothetical protein
MSKYDEDEAARLLAEDAITKAGGPGVPTAEQARLFHRMMTGSRDPNITGWRARQVYVVALAHVTHVATAMMRRAAQDRRDTLGIVGRPAVPDTIPVRTRTGETQLKLWPDAAPAEFVEAVFREQKIIDGRHRANQLRVDLAHDIKADPVLEHLPTLRDVCVRLSIDPDTLGLDDLAVDAS